MNTGLTVADVCVNIDTTPILRNITVDVAAGEIVALLGPSGCGKTTLLQTVAGLVPLSRGRIAWGDDDLAQVPPHRRGFGLMFQDHALFPHLDVAANVTYGLKVARVERSIRERRADELLELVDLAGFGSRKIGTLSGGEAQRVALARALAPAPRLLMLDEPLGSLDLDLRRRLTSEMRRLLHRLGLTALHVTHDHEEAFAIADRVAIMREGTIVRVGTGEALWRDPGTEEIARFLGHTDIVDVPSVGRAVVLAGAVTATARVGAIEIGATVAEQRFARGSYLTTVHTAWGTLHTELEDRYPIGAELALFVDPNRIASLHKSDVV